MGDHSGIADMINEDFKASVQAFHFKEESPSINFDCKVSLDGSVTVQINPKGMSSITKHRNLIYGFQVPVFEGFFIHLDVLYVKHDDRKWIHAKTIFNFGYANLDFCFIPQSGVMFGKAFLHVPSWVCRKRRECFRNRFIECLEGLVESDLAQRDTSTTTKPSMVYGPVTGSPSRLLIEAEPHPLSTVKKFMKHVALETKINVNKHPNGFCETMML